MRSVSILGCGWLGKPLGKVLFETGYKVSGSTTQKDRLQVLQQDGIIPFLIKFEPEAAPDQLKGFFRSDVLVVSMPAKRGISPQSFLAQMAAVAREAGKGAIQKVLYISSSAVYPDCNGMVYERDADPQSIMVQAENLFREQPKFETTVIRFGGLVGPGRHPGNFLSGKKDLPGANNPVNIIHLKDCIGIIQTILTKGAWGEVFNACAGQHPSKEEFYTKASRQLAKEPPRFSTEGARFKIVNTEKLVNRLGYSFTYNDPLQMTDF